MHGDPDSGIYLVKKKSYLFLIFFYVCCVFQRGAGMAGDRTSHVGIREGWVGGFHCRTLRGSTAVAPDFEVGS